jgi:hypothetical protein
VERTVQYVRGNFFAGEDFVDLADAQARAVRWCAGTAGLRVHGTTQQRPAQAFAAEEAALLLPAPTERYDVPLYATAKVHRDHHIEVGKALYSLPGHLIGAQGQVRADAALVKVFHRGQLIKTHPRVEPGRRATDRADYPAEKVGYAMRDLDALLAQAAAHGPSVGAYAARLLDVELPWTRMRTVYRLLGLARREGSEAVDAACAKTLAIDVVDVRRIVGILEAAREHEPGEQPRVVVPAAARFARSPAEFVVGTAPGGSS